MLQVYNHMFVLLVVEVLDKAEAHLVPLDRSVAMLNDLLGFALLLVQLLAQGFDLQPVEVELALCPVKVQLLGSCVVEVDCWCRVALWLPWRELWHAKQGSL
jgi:hypothetical protein